MSSSPRIALVTPYNGGNLGDAAIQDSMILNLRLHMPSAEFLGITLGGENFVGQHGSRAFPYLASVMPFGKSPTKTWTSRPNAPEDSREQVSLSSGEPLQQRVRRTLRRIPGLVPLVRRVKVAIWPVRREVSHWMQGYRMVRSQDLLLISGGGQFDEEYGGAWRLPFAIFKWTLLARLAKVPCAIASVGAGRINSLASRFFVYTALRLSNYRSYREAKTRAIVASLWPRALNDVVVPDLAFSLPEVELPSPSGNIREMAHGRLVVVLTPMAYGKPGDWPTANAPLHDRYVAQLAHAASSLLRRDCFLVIACSSIGDDDRVIPDLLGRIDDELKSRLDRKIHLPTVKTWRDLVAVLREGDCVVSSRLHGLILSFLAQTPAIAISCDPKIDWVMEDLGQMDYLLHFKDFTSEDLLKAFDRLHASKNVAVERIASYRRQVLSGGGAARQYEFLAALAHQHQRLRK